MVLLLLRALKTKFKDAVISGEEILEAGRLYSKQHYNSSNSTCTEFRLQRLVQFFTQGQRQTQNHKRAGLKHTAKSVIIKLSNPLKP